LELTALPRPLAGFKGPTSKERRREGERMEGEGRERVEVGRGRKRKVRGPSLALAWGPEWLIRPGQEHHVQCWTWVWGLYLLTDNGTGPTYSMQFLPVTSCRQ